VARAGTRGFRRGPGGGDGAPRRVPSGTRARRVAPAVAAGPGAARWRHAACERRRPLRHPRRPAALEAVPAEPEVRDADRIVVTGDIAAGAQPVEVLDRLTELGDRVVWVRGNADRDPVEYLRTGHLATPDEIAPGGTGEAAVPGLRGSAPSPRCGGRR